MAYEIIFSKRFDSRLSSILSYYNDELENPLVASRVLREIRRALNQLKISPTSNPILEDDELNGLGLRRIRLRHYKYKIFYTIDGNQIVVIDILHDLQDADNLLK